MSAAQDDYNRAGFLTFIASMIFTFLFFGYLCFLHPGVEIDKVKAKASADLKMAGTAGDGGAAAVVDVSANKTPWESSEAMINHGKTVYQTNCAVCHGNGGLGDGPAGVTLNPKPRDFVEGKWKADGSTIGLFNSVKNGLPGTAMAAFGHISVIDRWAAVHYVQSLTKNKIESKPEALAKFGQTEK